MLALNTSRQVLVCTEAIDMRRSHDGLAALVANHLRAKPDSGQYFVFFNRSSTRVKIFYWDRTGYCFWYKRLECGAFKRPRTNGLSYRLEASELSLLLEGVDLTHPRLRRFK